MLDVLHRDRVALRIHDGGLSTVKFMVQTLAAAGELQRALQCELTYDGLRSAEAKGSKGGPRPDVPAGKTADVCTAYREGRSIAALARDHRVSRGAIRTAVADLLPGHTATEEDAPARESPVTLEMSSKVVDFLRTAELEPAERAALDQGAAVRRGQGYTLRVSAVPAVHRQLLARCQPLDGSHGLPAVPASARPATSTGTGQHAHALTESVLSDTRCTDVPRGRRDPWVQRNRSLFSGNSRVGP
ncbi:hypothetical protein ACF059_31150 [Streptomyces sp. NPDC016562]|uniref:hypothetical protein n=1 Tax=Streptomyces sp. NPDC016562 TaxID=3364966 RepID=UPI0036F8412F